MDDRFNEEFFLLILIFEYIVGLRLDKRKGEISLMQQVFFFNENKLWRFLLNRCTNFTAIVIEISFSMVRDLTVDAISKLYKNKHIYLKISINKKYVSIHIIHIICSS